MSILRGLVLLGVLAPLLLSGPALKAAEPARVAIIIDDLGFRADQDRAVLGLDRRIAVAVIPNAPRAGDMARLATAQRRELLVHLPLAHAHQQDCDAPVCPRREWSAERMRQHLAWAFDEVEGAIGINNHQGSLFTSDAAATRRLVEGLVLFNRERERPLFVIDSRTSPGSMLAGMAVEAGLSAGQRQVFLDHERSLEAIERAWLELLRLSRRDGSAIAIGHPHPETIEFLNQAVAMLEDQGIRLVPISSLLKPAAVRRPGNGHAAAAAAYTSPTVPARP